MTLSSGRRNHSTDPPIDISTAQPEGQGEFLGIQAQLQYNDEAITQVKSCALRAWDRVEESAKPHQSFLKICQGSHEAYRLHSSVD